MMLTIIEEEWYALSEKFDFNLYSIVFVSLGKESKEAYCRIEQLPVLEYHLKPNNKRCTSETI